ncbi:hypothetical protein QJS10_CPB14g01361 [Acorus calamus]|uniref:Uncharacterized protein n=1 Tax=Acorus calamus TaxID=4465 RepID=A0AAV9DDI0_ACOCL|nr:hypothetical protein QJS10_CPB14g01361 [Acorus calamus]
MATVLDAWQIEAVGNPLFLSVRKLANVKKALKLWNSKVFGPIQLKLSVSKKELEDAKSRLQQLPADPIYIAEEADARSTYLSLLLQEEKFAWQKSRQLWLTAGDSNTKFFYNSIKSRSVMNSISRLRHEDNSLCSDQEEIKSLIVQYYQNLLNREAPLDLQLSPPPCLVSPTENSALCSPVSEKELRSVIFGLKALSSPGPDGFPASSPIMSDIDEHNCRTGCDAKKQVGFFRTKTKEQPDEYTGKTYTTTIDRKPSFRVRRGQEGEGGVKRLNLWCGPKEVAIPGTDGFAGDACSVYHLNVQFGQLINFTLGFQASHIVNRMKVKQYKS